MYTLLQINTALGRGSVGALVARIGAAASAEGWRSVVAHGRRYVAPAVSAVESVVIGSRADEMVHLAASRLLDRHGLASRRATRRLVELIRRDIRPDVVHLHNLHGYYLNYPELFGCLAEADVPVVWTLHDCWSFTGHCGFYDAAGCRRWLRGCGECPCRRVYPASCGLSRSAANFRLKRRLFTSLGDRLTLVTPSRWLAAEVGRSFMQGTRTVTIPNGIDLSEFTPVAAKVPRSVLGVAMPWTAAKGLDDFSELRRLLPAEYEITLVGLSAAQLRRLPRGIRGVGRISDPRALAREYSRAGVYVNLTYQDNYPTVNLEALACGTPVVTYASGGSPEAVTADTGAVVPTGDVAAVARAVMALTGGDIGALSERCRRRAEAEFDVKTCTQAYIDMFKKILF